MSETTHKARGRGIDLIEGQVASKDAEGENDDSEYMASDSLRAARVSYLGEEVQRKYRDICEQRGLSYSYVVEEGEPLRVRSVLAVYC